MSLRKTTIAFAALAACACNQTANNSAESKATLPANETAPAPAPQPSADASSNVSLPHDRKPLEEPKGPIDPKSAEAAGQVVQHYGSLIENSRWTESWKLWSDPAAAKTFDRNWVNNSEVHMEIGKPGGMEGAAGSSYVTMPVVFYGKTKSGSSFRRGADVILRRVNDVPGSRESQRRWHIDHIEWKSGA